jgi:hypothetical protein
MQFRESQKLSDADQEHWMQGTICISAIITAASLLDFFFTIHAIASFQWIFRIKGGSPEQFLDIVGVTVPQQAL